MLVLRSLTEWLFVALVAMNLCACAEQETYDRLVLVVEAEPGMRASATELRVSSPTGERPFDMSGKGKNSKAWPLTESYYAPSGLRGVMEISAFAGERLLTTRRIDLTFASGRRVLYVLLADACELPGGACPEALTCGNCGICIDTQVDGRDLPQINDVSEAVDLTVGSCVDGSETGADAGGKSDGGANGVEDDEPEGGGQPDSGEGGTGSELVLEAPPAVATETCLPLVLRRSDATAAATFSMQADVGTLHDDAACQEALTSEIESGASERTVYYLAPASLSGAAVMQLQITAALGSSEASASLSLRLRARNVARGSYFGCAHLSDGSLYCAGSPSQGSLGTTSEYLQPVPTRASSVDAIATDAVMRSEGRASCLLSEGKLACWGDGTAHGDGQNVSSPAPVVAQGMGSGVVSFDPGQHHMCSVKSGHTLWCWGQNYGQPCPGSDGELLATPVNITDVPMPMECAAGRGSLCARTETGDVYCRGNIVESATTVKVNLGGLKARRIVASYRGACAIVDAQGQDELRCFSDGESPTRVVGLPSGVIDDVSTLGTATCASVAGALYCWGDNEQGWLVADQPDILTSPTRVSLPNGKLEQVALGYVNGVAISAIVDGLVYTWGLSADGSLGLGGHGVHAKATSTNMLEGRTNVSSLSIGVYAGCALDSGKAYCWGAGGEIGNGRSDVENGAFSQHAREPLGLAANLSQVSVGSQFAMATNGAESFGWGVGGWGQLGNGSTDPFNAWAPIRATAVEALDGDIRQLETESYKACGRTSTNAVYCWGGWGPYASITHATLQLVTGANATVSDIAVWEDGGCLLRAGSVECWTNDDFTPVPRTDFGSSVVDIDGAGPTLCARHADGSASCSYFHDVTVPAFASGVEELRAGSGFACARLSSGSLHCAGYNWRGQLGRADTTSGVKGESAVEGLVAPVTQFDAGPEVSCARDAEGWKCWGDNRHNVMSVVPWVYSTPQLVAPWQ